MLYFRYLLPALWVAGFALSLPVLPAEALSRLAAIGLTVIAAAAALAAAVRPDGTFKLPAGLLFGAAGGFWLLFLLAAFWSAAPFISLIAVGTFSLLPLTLLAFTTGAASYLRPALYGTGMVLALLAGWALYQYFFWPALLVSGQVRVPFADPNAYALLLALGFFGAIGLLCSEAQQARRILCTGFAVLTLAAIMVTGSRSVLLLLPIALAVFLLLGRSSLAGNRRALAVIIGSGVALFILFSALAGGEGSGRRVPVERVAALAAVDADSYSARIALWRSTLDIIRDYSLRGTGPGTYFLYYPEYRTLQDTASGGFMAHNDPLQFWAEAGIAAPLLFYLFVFAALIRMRRYLKTAPPDAPQRCFALALFCGLGILVVRCHINFDFYVASILMLGGLLLAAWYQATGAVDDKVLTLKLPVRFGQGAAQLAVCLPFITLLALLPGFFLSEHYMTRARAAALAGDMQAYAEEVNRAGRAGFGWNARPYVMAAEIPLAILEDNAGMLADGEAQALRRQAQDLLARAERYNKRLPSVPYYRARLALAGDDGIAALSGAAAERLLRQALRLDPLYLPARLRLAALYQRRGEQVQALALLKDGLLWPYATSERATYFEMTAALARAQGDEQTYELARRRAAEKR